MRGVNVYAMRHLHSFLRSARLIRAISAGAFVFFSASLASSAATNTPTLAHVGQWPSVSLSSMPRLSLSGSYLYAAAHDSGSYPVRESGALIFDVLDPSSPKV